MKCISKERTYHANTEAASYLIGETKDGKKTRMLNGLTLTVNAGGFKLTNAAGEVLRQGKETDAFAIVDGMTFEVSSLKLKTPDFNGGYYDYEDAYGYGRVEREHKAKFYIYAEEQPEGVEGFAFGAVRYDRNKTLAIHSLYVPGRFTAKEQSKCIAEYLLATIRADERIIANISGGLPKFMADDIRVYAVDYSAKIEQARLLYDEAKERKSNISEVFSEGMHYTMEGLYAQDEGEKTEL